VKLERDKRERLARHIVKAVREWADAESHDPFLDVGTIYRLDLVETHGRYTEGINIPLGQNHHFDIEIR
jgi:hypothetical protein